MRFKTMVHIRANGKILEYARSDFGSGKILSRRRIRLAIASPSSQRRIKYLIDVASIHVSRRGVEFVQFENWSPEYEEYTTRHMRTFGSNHPKVMSYNQWQNSYEVFLKRWQVLEDKQPELSYDEHLEWQRLSTMLAV